MANVMAIFQDVDKCMRCNGCVIACKRTWELKLPTSMDDVIPTGGTPAQTVKPRTRLAIKSQRRSDMGAFMRFSCWHCPSPPCVPACPLGAMKKEATGAVSVDRAKCQPAQCRDEAGNYPCQWECQRGGYPKIGVAYEGDDNVYMNKCTLCHGRAGAESAVDANTALPTRASTAEITAVPEKAHEPACVSSCPAKAMVWDTRANILALAQTYSLDGRSNWLGDGSMFWGSKKQRLAPPKADPFIEDHVTPMLSGLGAKLIVPTLVVGGLAAMSARRVRIESGEEV